MSLTNLWNLARILKARIGWVERTHKNNYSAVLELPLPKDHWLYGDPECEREGFEPPPMTMRMGTDNPCRPEMTEKITKAARYAIRAATMKGTEDNFDPDALVQCFVVGLLGYYTSDGLSHTGDDWANPNESE